MRIVGRQVTQPDSAEQEGLSFSAQEGKETGFDTFDAGTLGDSWRQQPGAPCYCRELTLNEMPAANAAAERAGLPKRRDLAFAAVAEGPGGAEFQEEMAGVGQSSLFLCVNRPTTWVKRGRK
jgi:hypothetical protein